jgi:UDP-N-acetylmuramoylalanine--D-glutamate ligase
MKLVVGIGLTGLSCIRYLCARGDKVAAVDSRAAPPELAQLQQEFPNVAYTTGGFESPLWEQAAELVVSPGVSLKEPPIARCLAKGVPIIGDVEIFARDVQKPVIAITGSNGKTTVTSLVGKMVADAGYSVEVCGNIGQPVLTAITKPLPDFYVSELSSFQLETTYSLKPLTAVVLNVCQDHMDRYDSYEDYYQAKRRVYRGCQYPIVNAEEPEIWQGLSFNQPPVTFSLHPQNSGFCLRQHQGEFYLALGEQLLLPVKAMQFTQQYEFQNALAALALGNAAGLPMESMLETLRKFSGLPHRCQAVGEFDGVRWYDDSKGTNVGATIAALLSLGLTKTGRLFLIAGGDSKKADLSALLDPVSRCADHLILLGQDAPLLQNLFQDKVPLTRVASMQEAVRFAADSARSGDIVLLSPACASMDMFRNYAHRGEVFVQAIHDYYQRGEHGHRR